MNEHADVSRTRASAPSPTMHNSFRREAIRGNSEIPRYCAATSPVSMLASTVAAQSSTPKKKNPVRTLHLFAAMASPVRIERTAQLPHAATTAPDRASGHGIDRDASAPGGDRNNHSWTPTATAARKEDAESGCRAGFRPDCRSVSHSAIRLSRILSCYPLSQLRATVGGSVGIPDSLDTKQVSTSGPAVVPCCLIIVFTRLARACQSPSAIPSSYLYFLNEVDSFAVSFWAGVDVLQSGDTCLTCANVPGIPLLSANSLELTPETYCAGSRDRATFVASPEKRNRKTFARHGRRLSIREPVIHDWGPLCASSKTTT
ncbi:Uncharacterised protein [Amycolatopsis camponoti]|uniref:Uncharacterized protein n=1 Tax=Amycolatopsis camponoti TaxID=2606593 RepID=A0A6I8LX03_9PSEU|nr:Uncharacterised protein [Amycolatopsis camponoti]